MAKKVIISLDAGGTRIDLSDGRIVEARRPSNQALRGLPWAARRPGWGDARGSVDRLIGASLRPQMTALEVSTFSSRDRQRLMLQLVRSSGGERDWRALYGSFLSPDERFCATMRWAQGREFEKLRTELREIRRRMVVGSGADLAAISGAVAPLNSSKLAERLGTWHNQMPAMRMVERWNGGSLAAFYKGLGINQMAGLQKMAEPLMKLGTVEGALATRGIPESVLQAGSLRNVRLGADLAQISASIAPAMGFALKDAHSSVLKSIIEGSAVQSMVGAEKLNGIIGKGLIQHSFATRGIGQMMLRDFNPGWTVVGALGGFESLRIPRISPDFGAGFTEGFQRTVDGLIIVEYRRVWRDDPMWFLLSHLSPKELPQLLRQSQERVYKAILASLEDVVLRTPVIPALRAALDSMGFLSEEQRQWLEHGLEHVEKGDWLQALPPLFFGYEGGLYNSAIDMKAIPKTNRGKQMAAEKIIKAFDLGDALETFALKLVFGGRGNSFRHGRPENQARDQVLLMVVAIVAWVDFIFDTRGTERLVHELHEPLSRVLGRGEAAGLSA